MIDLKQATEATSEVIAHVVDLFEYHQWNEQQLEHAYPVSVRLQLAYVEILKHVPPCADRTRALNCLTDAKMLSNSAITHGGRY